MTACPAAGPSEAEVVDLLMTRALWSCTDAATARAVAPRWAFGGHALRAALAELIADHDLNQPGTAESGCDRVQSIWAWVAARADDVAAARTAREDWAMNGYPGPEPYDPYRDVAASLHAEYRGHPDPALLRHAGAVLSILPELTAPDTHTEATTTQLLTQLGRLRAANLT